MVVQITDMLLVNTLAINMRNALLPFCKQKHIQNNDLIIVVSTRLKQQQKVLFKKIYKYFWLKSFVSPQVDKICFKNKVILFEENKKP